jgi:hypothetical protein
MRLVFRRGRLLRYLAAATVIGTVVGFGWITRTGRYDVAVVLRFLTYYAGAFALVAASVTVLVGLTSTNRIVLTVRYRLAAQFIHRAMAVLTIVFLVTHIVLQIDAGHVHVIDSVVPFLASRRTFYVGLGTVAADLLILVAATGALRSRFARGQAAWAWRIVHSVAYLAWPLAIAHGLLVGPPPSGFVAWTYGIGVLAVGGALLVRLLAAPQVGSPLAGIPSEPDGQARTAASVPGRRRS